MAASIKAFQKLDDPYADRCQYWLKEFEVEFQKRSRLSGRREIRLPLILTGHGISLSIESGALKVRDGLTHYPQDRIEHRFFPGKHNTPSRIVLLGQTGNVSIDALCWLSAQNIPLVVFDYRGESLSRTCSDFGVSDYELRLAQLLATRPDRALEIAQGLIRTKIAGQLGNLELWPISELRGYTEHKLAQYLESVEHATDVRDLMTVEATAAQAYFKAWQVIEIKWTSKSERIIPEDWKGIAGRESKVSGINRNASHPVNAILNYAYGVLESQVRIAIGLLGFDPSISYLHAMKHGRSSLIFDLMEPLRARVDRNVIEFIRSHELAKEDFNLSIEGVCKLSPSFAKRILLIGIPDPDVQATIAKFRDQILKTG